MTDKKSKKMASAIADACRAMRSIANELRDKSPEIAKKLDESERNLTQAILDYFDIDNLKIENQKKKKNWFD